MNDLYPSKPSPEVSKELKLQIKQLNERYKSGKVSKRYYNKKYLDLHRRLYGWI